MDDDTVSFAAYRFRIRGWFVVLIASVLVACGAPGEAPASNPPASDARSTSTPLATSTSVARAPQGSVASLMDPTVTPPPGGEIAALDESAQDVQGADTPSSGGETYVVAAGDTLLDLAMRFDVPMAAIQLRNELGASHVIQVGRALVIPSAEAWSHASPFWMLHEVGLGETLGEIAQAYDLSQKEILAANDLTQPDLLSVGQPLVLPVEAPMEVAAVQPPTAVPEPTSVPEPTATPTAEAVASTSESDPVTATVVASATPTRRPTAVPPAEASSDMAALAQEIFRLINEQRAIHGRPPLTWNATLAVAAQQHAEDCHQRGWCGHTGSDGSTMKTRIIRAGYNPARWSECWAWYRSPSLAVTMWMDEEPPNDPHRRTILATHLTEVGVGVMPGNGHGYYFIADFGKPKP